MSLVRLSKISDGMSLMNKVLIKTNSLPKKFESRKSDMDETYLFTDEDIDNYLVKKNPNCKRIFILKAAVVEPFCAKGCLLEDLNIEKEDLNKKYNISPINIRGMHWIVFVIKQKKYSLGYSFCYDPSNPSCDEAENNRKCSILNEVFSEARGYTISYIKCSDLDIIPPYETNGFDCGPLICGFVIKLCQQQYLETINVTTIREEVAFLYEQREIDWWMNSRTC